MDSSVLETKEERSQRLSRSLSLEMFANDGNGENSNSSSSITTTTTDPHIDHIEDTIRRLSASSAHMSQLSRRMNQVIESSQNPSSPGLIMLRERRVQEEETQSSSPPRQPPPPSKNFISMAKYHAKQDSSEEDNDGDIDPSLFVDAHSSPRNSSSPSPSPRSSSSSPPPLPAPHSKAAHGRSQTFELGSMTTTNRFNANTIDSKQNTDKVVVSGNRALREVTLGILGATWITEALCNEIKDGTAQYVLDAQDLEVVACVQPHITENEEKERKENTDREKTVACVQPHITENEEKERKENTDREKTGERESSSSNDQTQEKRRHDKPARSSNKRNMDSNQNGPPSLHKLLASNPLRLLYFDFLKAEHSIENLLFYEACQQYHQRVQQRTHTDPSSSSSNNNNNDGRAPSPPLDTEMDVFEEAHQIYLQFLQPNKALHEVNLPSRLLKPLVMIFEEKHGQSRSNVDLLPDHIFTPAMNNIHALMENDSYARFLQSSAGKLLQPPPPPNTTTTTTPLVSSGEDEHVTSSEEEHDPHTKQKAHTKHDPHTTHQSSSMLRRAFSSYTVEEKKKEQEPQAADGHGQDHTSSSSSATHHATSSSLFRRARKMVSLQKRRYQQDGFDLDLSYVTERVIAMGFPSQGMQGLYRNPQKEVVKFFNQYHHGHFRIYNLCNERDYSCDTFGKEDGSNVKRYPFEDHNPCALHVMYEFCLQVESYLKEDPNHVVAIHCKAGKGRTGLLISALLVHQGLSSSFALRLYAERRTKNNKGLTIPSQRRYVQYYSKYIQCPEYYNRLSAIPRRILSVTMSPCPAKSSAIHVIGKTPPYHGSYDSTRPLPASDCTTLLDTVQVPNVACVREDQLLRLMMPPPGGSSGGVGGLVLGDVQFSMTLRVGKKVTRKIKKKITKRGTRIGEKTGFWLHTSMVPLDGSSVVFHKEDLDHVFKKKCPVFNEKCCVTLCMSPIDREMQLQIMDEVKQHTHDTQEKQRKERLEREHRQITLRHKKEKLQSHKNFFSHNSATMGGGGGGGGGVASSGTMNVHKNGAAATVAEALPRRMSFSQLKFKQVLLQKKQKTSSFSQVALHQPTEREAEKEEEEGEEEGSQARPTDFHHHQSDLIQRAKLLPLPSSPETPMALMMSPVVHLRSPHRTHTLGPWIAEAREIVASTPQREIQREIEKEIEKETGVKHQDDEDDLQWQPIQFYGTTRPPPRPLPRSPPLLLPPSPPLVVVSLEEDTASKEENEEEWLTQRTMKKTPPSLSFQWRKKRGLQQQTNTTRPFTITTRRNTFFGPPSSSPTSRTTSPFKKLPSPPFQRPLPPTLVLAAARRERRRRSLYIGQLMKEQDLAQAHQQHQHELLHNNNSNSNNNNTAPTQSSNRNTGETKRSGGSRRVVPRVAPRVVPKTGSIALTVLRAMETLKQQRSSTPTSKEGIPFVGTTRRGTVFRQEHELPRRLQSSSSLAKSPTKNSSKDAINHVVKKVGPSLYLKMYLNGKMEVLSSRDSKSPIKLDYCGSGETQWYSEHHGR